MKTNRTELVFILDRSGSMCGLESDTIGGYNSMLARQKKEEGEVAVTTVLFSNHWELLHDRIPLRGVAPITEKEYYVGGGTALLDAIGAAIQKIVSVQKHTAPELRADKVLFVIMTDGMENASRSYRCDQIKQMIAQEKEEYGWEFLFLGANIDAVSTAGQFGIQADRAVTYRADSAGTQLNYQVVSEAVSCVRAGAPLAPSWKAPIERDVRTRKGK